MSEMHAMTKIADLAKELHNLECWQNLRFWRSFTNFVKLVKPSIGIDSSWVNIGDFGEFDKIGNFGDLLPIWSNYFIHWY